MIAFTLRAIPLHLRIQQAMARLQHLAAAAAWPPLSDFGHRTLAHAWVLLFMAMLAGSRSSGQPHPLDEFETLEGWNAVTSHGDASKLSITSSTGRTGRGMMLDFSFLGHMGSASAEKKFGIPLPPNYQISFDLRGDAPANNFILRLMDSTGNVWVVMRPDYTFPASWTKFSVRKDQIRYGWGPAGSGELTTLHRIMIMIDVVEGGKGKIWIDNLTVEPLDAARAVIPSWLASSTRKGSLPSFSADGKVFSGWRSDGRNTRGWITFEFGKSRIPGGLVIDWGGNEYARVFDVLLSYDGKHWSKGYSVTNARGGRSYVPLERGDGNRLKLALTVSASGKGFCVDRLEFKGSGFSFSINEFFEALASDSPRGSFPRYSVPEQSYWTIVGVPGDTKEALINEDGMIETDKLSYSLEPFLFLDGRLITWNDVSITQTLEQNYLPIPSVRWATNDSIVLTITAVASGPEQESILYVRYRLENAGAHAKRGKLFIALRPFQVNPPWQTFTIVGGPSRVDSIHIDHVVRVNGRTLVPLTQPDAAGAAEFDQGHVTEFLRKGSVPPSKDVHDHFAYASGALEYGFNLDGGGRKDVIIASPFHDRHAPVAPAVDERGAAEEFERIKSETAAFWESKLSDIAITLPPGAPPIENTIKSNLAFIMINADGPALQPGSRSYERSWIRDGSLTAAALLEMGLTSEVRRYIDWYASYQYPDGAIPCIVEPRGPEPTPEHDSHGEFLYMIAQYFRFTHDRAWLQEKWESVAKTARYIHTLRDQRKTDLYVSGTPEQQACFGLVPESISHEGYCPKPMHSYWDDFFIMRGLKDAAFLAAAMGRREEAEEFAGERDDFQIDLSRSLLRSIRNKNIDFIPGCAELGDFSGLSTTVAITPCEVEAILPQRELSNTFDTSYRMFQDRKANRIPWDAYLPYEARFIGAYVYLGERDRANDVLDYLMRDRRPLSWNGWGEVVWKDYRAPKNVGDMPHAWAASDFIRSVRSMFVYERERDAALVLGAGIPRAWIDVSPGVSVRALPTYYGPLSYTMVAHSDSILVNLSGNISIPPGGIVIKPPLAREPKDVLGDARLSATGEIVVDRLPAHVVICP